MYSNLGAVTVEDMDEFRSLGWYIVSVIVWDLLEAKLQVPSSRHPLKENIKPFPVCKVHVMISQISFLVFVDITRQSWEK